MNHPVRTQWQRYAADQLKEQEREQLEAHLATCEQCLLEYIMAAQEAGNAAAAEWTEERAEVITDEVMAAIGSLGQEMQRHGRVEMQLGREERHREGGAAVTEVGGAIAEAIAEQTQHKEEAGEQGAARRRRPENRQRAKKQRLLHYVIAVCFMLLMMSAGVFDRLAEGPAHWKSGRELKSHESLADSIMARTSGVIDAFVAKQQTDERHK